MAVGRIFRISKDQASSYELIRAPKFRKARPNPGVTAIMGISNPARPNPKIQFTTKDGKVVSFNAKGKKRKAAKKSRL